MRGWSGTALPRSEIFSSSPDCGVGKAGQFFLGTLDKSNQFLLRSSQHLVGGGGQFEMGQTAFAQKLFFTREPPIVFGFCLMVRQGVPANHSWATA
jgi:hypothetical protein